MSEENYFQLWGMFKDALPFIISGYAYLKSKLTAPKKKKKGKKKKGRKGRKGGKMAA